MASNWLRADNHSQENVQKSKYEDLYVFGYGCKIFRDDEQAKLVDAGKYLIPWMGDERLKIDRYDGRGHLFDLAPYDADLQKGQHDVESEEEKKVEALCDEERYLELHTDLTEKSIYEEEEWKRYYESLSEGYKAVGFSYDYGGQHQYAYTEEAVKQEDPEEQAFVPPTELHIPPGMQIPSTNREAAIIEKTAKFIASHGAQMEIMMKTKQANNPKFMFMHFEDTLHPYYRHLVKMIKSGKYKPKTEEKQEEEHDDGGDGEGSHSYLHPALLQTNRASPTPEVYKPVPIQMPKVSIHETSYGQLLKSLSKVNQDVAERMKPKEVKKEIKTEPQDGSGLPACMAQPVYGPPVSAHNGMPPPPGIEPVTLPQSLENGEGGDAEVKQEPVDDITPMDHSHLAHIIPPPPDVQPVVDRMAMYVAKNGPEFEIVVKSKNDSRFEFLHSYHLHFAYYDFKKQLFIKEFEKERERKEKENKETAKDKEEEEDEQESEDKDKSSSGIKFKVKVKGKEQEAVTFEKKKVFENESSDENEDSEPSEYERVPRSGTSSRTSTPVADKKSKPEKSSIDQTAAEKRLAEQRVRDRIAASAREKLSQVDKEKQLQAERKKRAAMFINMLKGSNTDSGAGQTNDTVPLTEKISQASSRANTPSMSEISSSRPKSKSKHKHKDRRRSDSRDRSRSRDRSPSRSKSKKKKRKRSPTPPSAYAVARRSPLRFPPPPPPPRYQSRERSLSISRSNIHRSKSRSPVRSKSKKKKRSRSRSPSKSTDSKTKSSKSHSKSKKKKKKKSRSRSPSRKSNTTDSPTPDLKKVTSEVSIVSAQSVDEVSSPVAMETVESELEEGETRDPTDTEENLEENNVSERSSALKNRNSESPRERTDTRSRSRSRESVKNNESESRHSSVSRHSSRSRSPSRSKSRSHSRSRSRSLSRKRSRHSSASSHHSSQECRRSRSHSKSSRKHSSVSPQKQSLSLETGDCSSKADVPSTPASPDKEVDSDSSVSGTSTPRNTCSSGTQKNVSEYMLNRVRAIIKASREAILKEDGPFLDDT